MNQVLLLLHSRFSSLRLKLKDYCHLVAFLRRRRLDWDDLTNTPDTHRTPGQCRESDIPRVVELCPFTLAQALLPRTQLPAHLRSCATLQPDLQALTEGKLPICRASVLMKMSVARDNLEDQLKTRLGMSPFRSREGRRVDLDAVVIILKLLWLGICRIIKSSRSVYVVCPSSPVHLP